MKIKLISSLFIAALLMVGNPFLSEADAANRTDPITFETGDGKWDGSVTARVQSDVSVHLYDWSPRDQLKVRLCNASSGNCTGYRQFDPNTGHSATFYNVLPGTYYGDVAKVENPWRNVRGMLAFQLHEGI
ncbi:hypothetical protein [Virgibacillus ainsalahensis]